MRYNFLRDIWDLRGKVDLAIFERRYDDLPNLEIILNELFEEFKCSNSKICNDVNKGFQTGKEKEENFKKVLKNLQNIIARYVYELDVSEKFEATEKSIIEYIWLARTMFDTFVRRAKQRNYPVESNLKLIDAVLEKLNIILYKYKYLLSIEELNSLQRIIEEIEAKKRELYPKRKFVSSWDEVKKDF